MVKKCLPPKLTGFASITCHEPLQSEKFLSTFPRNHVAHDKTEPTKEKPPPGSEGRFLMTASAERSARDIGFISLDPILATLHSVSSVIGRRSTLKKVSDCMNRRPANRAGLPVPVASATHEMPRLTGRYGRKPRHSTVSPMRR
jgi:hypothetical protein